MSESNSHEETVKPDPNTLWKSPINSLRASLETVEGPIMEDRQKNSPNDESVVKSLKAAVAKFWRKYGTGFVEFWHTLTQTSRENFLWMVYPALPYSLTERYCFENGMKIHADRYDPQLVLNDQLTITGLTEGDVLIDMMKSCMENEYFVNTSCRFMNKLRNLIHNGKSPFSAEEKKAYKRELNLKKGDILIDNAGEESFGDRIEILNVKEMLENSRIGADGKQHKLYYWALLLHPTEHKHNIELLFFQLSIMINVIDEYKRVILGKVSDGILSKRMTGCANCDSEKTQLMMCSKCMLTFYCSKECQLVHWKSSHKVKCKAFCKALKERATANKQNAESREGTA